MMKMIKNGGHQWMAIKKVKKPQRRECARRPNQDPPPEKLELMKVLHLTNKELENAFKARNIQYFPNKLPRAGNKDVGDSTAAGTSTMQSNYHSAS
jgi:hypothetical protein